jgi:hypothetical protein
MSQPMAKAALPLPALPFVQMLTSEALGSIAPNWRDPRNGLGIGFAREIAMERKTPRT